MPRRLVILISFFLLASCVSSTIDAEKLNAPIKDAAELLLVEPSREIFYAGSGKLADGRNLNPVLSKSLRSFDSVSVVFPKTTVETIDGLSDYNVFAWRQTARSLGNGELRCDIAPAPVLDVGSLVVIANAALRLGTVAATFAPVKGKTLVTSYDSTDGGRIVSMKFVSGSDVGC